MQLISPSFNHQMRDRPPHREPLFEVQVQVQVQVRGFFNVPCQPYNIEDVGVLSETT